MSVANPDLSTRDRLLAAAGELLVERGFAATTTRAIAERAGSNSALVHYHFATKAQLLAEAAIGLLGDEVSAPMRMLRDAPSLGEGIGQAMRWLGELDVGEPAVRLLMELTMEAFRNEQVRPIVAEALEQGRREMAAAVAARGDVDEATAASLAALLIALFDGVVLHRMVDAGVDPAAWADAATWLEPRRPPRAWRRR